MKLEQKRGGYTKTFLLDNNTLKIIEDNILSSNEWSINLEHIGHNKEVKVYSRVGIKTVGYFFLVIAFLYCIAPFVDNKSNENITLLISGVFFFLLFAVICFKVPLDDNLTIIEGHKKIKFFLNSPSRIEVENFADELIKKSKKIISTKYSRVDSDIPEETFMDQMNWLLQNNYIDDKEYEEKKTEYKTLKLIK